MPNQILFLMYATKGDKFIITYIKIQIVYISPCCFP